MLLANIASMYAVYHDPKALTQIAGRIHQLTAILAQGLSALGLKVEQEQFFDTLTLNTDSATTALHAKAKHKASTCVWSTISVWACRWMKPAARAT